MTVRVAEDTAMQDGSLLSLSPRVKRDGGILPPLMSYAQNFEDVILRRALQDIKAGFYIDIGAFDPETDSVTKWFYEQGWSGINVEPNPEMHRRLCADRPRDINLDVAVGDDRGTASFWVVDGTGLSSLDRPSLPPHVPETLLREISVPVLSLATLIDRHAAGRTIDFLKIDAEGAEAAVIANGALDRHRPRIILIEATETLTQLPAWEGWEPSLLALGYRFALFDGLNRFYVRDEDAERLFWFRLPPGCFDNFRQIFDPTAVRAAELDRRLQDMFASAEFFKHALAVAQDALAVETLRADQAEQRLRAMWESAESLRLELTAVRAQLREVWESAQALEIQLAEAGQRTTAA